MPDPPPAAGDQSMMARGLPATSGAAAPHSRLAFDTGTSDRGLGDSPRAPAAAAVRAGPTPEHARVLNGLIRIAKIPSDRAFERTEGLRALFVEVPVREGKGLLDRLSNTAPRHDDMVLYWIANFSDAERQYALDVLRDKTLGKPRVSAAPGASMPAGASGSVPISDPATAHKLSGPPVRTPALAPITPQPSAPAPPGVAPGAYQASIAKANARQQEVGAAHAAGIAAGRRFGKAIGDAQEAIKMLKGLMAGGYSQPRFAQFREELKEGLAKKLNAIPLPPTYSDPDLQSAANSGFELGLGKGLEDAADEALAVTLAVDAALALQGEVGAVAESALGRALARLAKFPILVPGVGAGGIGLARIERTLGQTAREFLSTLKQGGKRLVFRKLSAEDAQSIMRVRSLQGWMAPTLAESGHIGPYDAFRMFTSNVPSYLRGEYEAHHIMEQRTLKLLNYPVDRAPSAILTNAEHIRLHKALNAAIDDISSMSKTEVWKAYQRVYKKEGYWLSVIAPYFR